MPIISYLKISRLIFFRVENLLLPKYKRLKANPKDLFLYLA